MLVHAADPPRIATREPSRPLAYVIPALSPHDEAPMAAGAVRRLGSVLEEFGLAVHVAAGGTELPLPPDDEAALDRASVVVCELPGGAWLPSVEVTLPAARRLPTIVLVPAGELLGGAAADLLGDATVVRYEGRPAGRALHTHLRALVED